MRGGEAQGSPSSSGAGPGGQYSVDQAQPDPQAATTAMLVGQLVQSARRLGMMYPAASEEMRTILNLMTKVQGKIVNSKPAPETSAPPI